jgi:hypothetical protein
MFKCRLCGEVFHNGAFAGEKIAERCMMELNVGLVSLAPMAPHMTETHNCGGAYAGTLGLADFQGWVAEENENGEEV